MRLAPLLLVFACSQPMATITATHLATSGNTTDGTTFATAAISPSPDRLVLAAVVSHTNNALSSPSLTGNGLTYVEVEHKDIDANRRVTLYRAMGSPSAGAVSIVFGSVQTSCAWTIVEYGTVDTSGTNGSGAIVGAAVTGVVTAGVTVNATLPAFGDTDNVHAAFVAISINGAVTHDADFAELGDAGVGAGTIRIESQWAVNTLACDPTFAAANAGIISVEVKAEADAPEPVDEPDEPPGRRPMIVIHGQSNALGSAQVSDVTIASGLTSLYPNVSLVQRMAANVSTDPPVFQNIGPASLGPRTIALEDGSPIAARMGTELTLGRALHPIIGQIVIAKYAIGAAGLDEHLGVASDYPTDGDNVHAQFLAWVAEQEEALNCYFAGLVWIQGNGDADDAGEAGRYQANLTALVASVRGEFGNVPLVVVKLHSSMAGAQVATVQAAQVAVVEDTRISALVDSDDLGLRDTDHYTADAFVTLGERIAAALIPLLNERWDVTTTAEIRDEQARLIEAITPTTAAQVKFRREEGRIDFRQWVAANPNACFRRFSIQGSLELEGPEVSNINFETYRTAIILTVAYPKQFGAYGGDNIRDLADLVHGDVFQIDDVIGHRGQNNFLAGQNYCTRRPEVPTEDVGAAWLVTMTFDTEFQREV